MTGNWLSITDLAGNPIDHFILSVGDAIATAGIMFIAAVALIFIALCCEVKLKRPRDDQ